VILADDSRYKQPKHTVEDKLMHSVYSVVFILIMKTMSIQIMLYYTQDYSISEHYPEHILT